MASGLPDYNSAINLALQTLSEITNRPKYGAAQRVVGSVAATASTQISLAQVSGKGQIYGGFISSLGTATQVLDYVDIEIDGVVFAGWTLNAIFYWNLMTQSAYPFHILRYDDKDFTYSVGVQPFLTFETSFEIFYEETYGRTPTIAYQISYAVV